MIPRDTYSRDVAGAAAYAERYREPADLDFDADDWRETSPDLFDPDADGDE